MEPKYLGGQAVLEGVLIRNGGKVVTAVRKKDGTITHRVDRINAPKSKILKLPLLRGVVTLIQTLNIGMKSLQYSAQEAMEEEKQVGKAGMFFSILFSIIFALAIFKFLPLLIAELINRNTAVSLFTFNAIEGFIKIGMFVAYLAIISKMEDIRRVFMYHGAEHKVVNCYEKEKKVTVKLAKKHSRIHKRCGTSFVLFVLFLSILVYLVIPLNLPLLQKFLVRIILLPVIAGISYEILKLSSKYDNSKLLTAFISPGLLLQQLTTKDPSDDQIEVAIHALNESLKD